MALDIIEVRVYNYFQYQQQVKQILETDMPSINQLLPNLLPIKITHQRLYRLNFSPDFEGVTGCFIKTFKNLVFSFEATKDERLLLTINNIKLPHVLYVHQLQNIYYDLTQDVLKRQEK